MTPDENPFEVVARLEAENQRLRGDRTALDLVVTGLRELEDLHGQAYYAALADIDGDGASVHLQIIDDISTLLDKIGANS